MTTVAPQSPAPTTSASLGDKGDLGNGVTVNVSKVESIEGEAQGPGEIGGPALRVSVTVENDTDGSLSMELALVNFYYGKGKTPAGELSGPGAAPLSQAIPAGDSATGVYVFGVPKNERSSIHVEFTYTTEAPKVIFAGSA